MQSLQIATSIMQLSKTIWKHPIKSLTAYKRCNQTNQECTVVQNQVNKFSKKAEEWWNPKGPRKTLFDMTPIRIEYVESCLVEQNNVDNKDKMEDSGMRERSNEKPLNGIKILDVGCGGGFLSEGLSKLGANVTGIDPNPTLIQIASVHKPSSVKQNLQYFNKSIEQFSRDHLDHFDAVVASEVIEHIEAKDTFLDLCLSTLKSKGLFILTSPQKTFFSYFCTIFLAENVIQKITKGTHTYSMYIHSKELIQKLRDRNCEHLNTSGLNYNPISDTWSRGKRSPLFYAVCVRKQ